MGDDSDSDWLKKNPVRNPIRMSLRRSNRFFPRSPDMDASLISNPGKQNQNQQLLAVPKLIRRTNIDLNKLKEMKFKVPTAPVTAKATAKRPNVGIPKPYAAGTKPRQSMIASHVRSDPKPNSSIPKSAESNLKLLQRPSMLFLARRSTLAPPSATRKPGIVERLVKLSESCAKYDTERSVLESSRIINQSTPNDPAAPRSILKQSQSNSRKELTFLKKTEDTTDKPKAAKRVNFESKTEKENVEEMKSEPEIQINEFAALEESTIAFTESFKPITFEEPKKETKPEQDKENPKNEVINEIIEACQSIWEELEIWDDKYRRLREAFAAELNKRSQFESDELLYNKFCLYRAKREEIFDKFKKIDKELDERVKEKVNIESELRKYMKEEENIHNNKIELKKKLRDYMESFKIKKEEKIPQEEIKNQNPVKRRSRSPGENLKKISDKSRGIKKPMGTKLNSKKKNAIYNDLQRSCNLDPVGSSPDEATNTPDNTPAKRRRLSKKIQRQLNTLFEDE